MGSLTKADGGEDGTDEIQARDVLSFRALPRAASALSPLKLKLKLMPSETPLRYLIGGQGGAGRRLASWDGSTAFSTSQLLTTSWVELSILTRQKAHVKRCSAQTRAVSISISRIRPGLMSSRSRSRLRAAIT